MMLAAAFALAIGQARPAVPPAADDKAKSVETNKAELNRLKNEELLKQAAGIYDKTAQDHLATARALASAEILLEETVKQTRSSGSTEAATPLSSARWGRGGRPRRRPRRLEKRPRPHSTSRGGS
jgi:hypothetical protein